MKAIIMGTIITALITGMAAAGLYAVMNGPDVTVERDGEALCSTVCGLMYACSHKAGEEDFKELLKRTTEVCAEPEGTEQSYRNEDGSLKHSVIIGDAETIKKQGTEFDTCIINWEVNKETALKAFKEVCLSRMFQPPEGGNVSPSEARGTDTLSLRYQETRGKFEGNAQQDRR